MTKNLFLYYCLNIVSQISLYRQQLDQSIRNEPILLIVDGHPSRFSFLCCYIFYLFNIDLLLLPPHRSHIIQPFDVSMASPLKNAFARCFYSAIAQARDSKQSKLLSAKEIRNAMIGSFLDSIHIGGTPTNIMNGFKASGIYPFNPNEPLASPYCTDYNVNDINFNNFWINSEDYLITLFEKENGRKPTSADFQIDFNIISHAIYNSSIATGRGLSKLPDILYEESGIIRRITL